jgi:hypothetical protein
MNLLDIQLCSGDLKGIWHLVGIALTIFKIVIPILIIIFGMIDFAKAVTSSKDDQLTKSAKQLGIRLAAGIIIFFMPTIVSFALGLVGNTFDQSGEFTICSECLAHPSKCE